MLTKNPPNGRTGKFSKYLLYPIGEIALVVIGILIALQINTWNEERTTIEQSIMPEGYERIIDEKAMADLIAYLRNPG